jgi:hypothetical protein
MDDPYQLYIAILSSKAYESLLFVDEGDIDDTQDYLYSYGPKGQRLHALKKNQEQPK